jgi:ribonucleoside-triphosphate reductase
MFGRDFRRLERATWVMARANYRQTCVNLKDDVLQPRWHQTNEALRLCGVSYTGIVNADWLTDYHVRRLRNAAVAGAYSMADDLGLPRPKAVTTIKPEGTRTKISGTVGQEYGEGMHRPLGRYVFNWINFSTADPLVDALEAAGYKTLPNPSDPNNVLVRFPVNYSGCKFDVVGGKEVNKEPALAQLRRYRRWNNLWADHNVSATISFDRDEIPAMAEWIHRHWEDGYVATAFMARTDPTKTAADLGHPYLPQEVVTEDAFAAATAALRDVDWDRFHTGWHEISDASDCPGGVCPVR